MNFKEATDGLLEKVDHARLAKAQGVSVASIRQARLSPKAHAHREAPAGWQAVVARLAKKQATQYQKLAEMLESDSQEEDRK